MNTEHDSEIKDFLADGKLVCLVGRALAQANDPRALYWLRRANDLKDPDAAIWMAWCFAKGLGCEPNIELSGQCYRRAIRGEAFETFSVGMEDALITLIYESGESEYSLAEDHYSRILDFLKHNVSRGSAQAIEWISGYYRLNGEYDDFFDLLLGVGIENTAAAQYLKEIADKVSKDRKAKLPPRDCPGQQLLPGYTESQTFW